MKLDEYNNLNFLIDSIDFVLNNYNYNKVYDINLKELEKLKAKFYAVDNNLLTTKVFIDFNDLLASETISMYKVLLELLKIFNTELSISSNLEVKKYLDYLGIEYQELNKDNLECNFYFEIRVSSVLIASGKYKDYFSSALNLEELLKLVHLDYDNKLDAFVVAITDTEMIYSNILMDELRQLGLKVDCNYNNSNREDAIVKARDNSYYIINILDSDLDNNELEIIDGERKEKVKAYNVYNYIVGDRYEEN